jgi:hypothetical protein
MQAMLYIKVCRNSIERIHCTICDDEDMGAFVTQISTCVMTRSYSLPTGRSSYRAILRHLPSMPLRIWKRQSVQRKISWDQNVELWTMKASKCRNCTKVCSDCDQQIHSHQQQHFVRKSDLQRHERIHTEDRPFTCHQDGCGSMFGQRGNPKAHASVHSGKKLHKCPSCEKVFSEVGDLFDFMFPSQADETSPAIKRVTRSPPYPQPLSCARMWLRKMWREVCAPPR